MTKTRTDAARRRLLIAMGLASAVYAAPLLTPLGMAHASGVSGVSRASRPSRPSRPSRSSRPARQAQPAPPPRPEMVVFLPAGMATAAVTGAGYSILSRVDNRALGGAMLRLGLPPGRSAAQARLEIATLLPGVLADDNHLYRPNEFLCDADGCAAHRLLGWTGLAGSATTAVPRIGMIDTGINADHAALAGQKLIVTQAELGERAAAGRQHGTAIAALLIGRADSRTPGLLPGAELVAVEAFHRDAAGEAADAFALSHALDQLLAAGVGVINLSFSGPANMVLERLVTEAATQGVALVAAAGNDGPGAAPAYPAAWPHVVAVTAVDDRLAPYRQASRGPHIDFAAPGVGLWTAASISGGRLRSGTSYAAPFVTAALAVERLKDPDAPPEAVIARLVACATDLGEAGFDEVFGHGLIADPAGCDSMPARYFPASGE